MSKSSFLNAPSNAPPKSENWIALKDQSLSISLSVSSSIRSTQAPLAHCRWRNFFQWLFQLDPHLLLSLRNSFWEDPPFSHYGSSKRILCRKNRSRWQVSPSSKVKWRATDEVRHLLVGKTHYRIWIFNEAVALRKNYLLIWWRTLHGPYSLLPCDLCCSDLHEKIVKSQD